MASELSAVFSKWFLPSVAVGLFIIMGVTIFEINQTYINPRDLQVDILDSFC